MERIGTPGVGGGGGGSATLVFKSCATGQLNLLQNETANGDVDPDPHCRQCFGSALREAAQNRIRLEVADL